MSTYRVPIRKPAVTLQLADRNVFNNTILEQTVQDHPLDNESVIVRYYKGINKAQQCLDAQRLSFSKPLFEPNRQLPELSNDLVRLFEPARMQWLDLGEYKGRTLKLLNLMSDPSTHTTKTFASLVMVARAIEHIRRTDEKIIILVTTSGNKGEALRSAVERAITLGLVGKKQLRVVMLTPRESVDKLRVSTLYTDPELRRLNSIALYSGESSSHLKQIGQNLQERYADEFITKYNTRLWYSLSLDNYQVPDSARAFFEYENLLQSGRQISAVSRLHVHTVSSAFGFLGYHLGRSVLVNEGITSWEENPGYFLVQHLKTPDMVLHNYFGSFDRRNLPQYTFEPTTGLYTQNQHAHFPAKTFDVEEDLDPTFYSHTPFTSSQMSAMIQQFGGGGIVVSLAECLERYALIRSILGKANISIATDPRTVTEWSTIMGLTGILYAIDREIIPDQTELVLHGTGYYARYTDYTPLCSNTLPTIDDTTSLETLKDFLRE